MPTNTRQSTLAGRHAAIWPVASIAVVADGVSQVSCNGVAALTRRDACRAVSKSASFLFEA